MYLKLVVVGRLGGEPVMTYLADGNPVTNFSVATDRKYNDRNGQKVSETTWVKVAVFGKQAENCNEYLSRGKMVLVEGRLLPDKQTGGPRLFNRQDGSQGAAYEMVADTVRFLSPKDESTSEAAKQQEDETTPF